MKHVTWADRAHRVLREHFRTMPWCLTEKELRKRMRSWYPFGLPRGGYPYAVWLTCCKQWRQAYFLGRNEVVVGKRKRPPKPDRVTLEMFPDLFPLERSKRLR